MTEVLMDSQGFLGRKDKGVIPVPRAYLDPQGKMESGEMMERLGHVGCLESRGHEVSLAPKAHLEFLDPRESEAWMAPTVPKEAWVPRVSPDLLDSRVLLGPRVSPGLRVPSALMEKRAHEGNLDSLACLALMGLRDTPGRKALLEQKETRVHLVLRGLWATRDLEVSRAWMEFGV